MTKIITKINYIILATFLAMTFTVGVVSAQSPKTKACETINALTEASCGEEDVSASESSVKKIAGSIVDILSVVAGAVAVIFIIIGGIKYVTSGGSPEKTKAAKNTILAALVGLAIIIATQFIINIAISFTEQLTGDE